MGVKQQYALVENIRLQCGSRWENKPPSTQGAATRIPPILYCTFSFNKLSLLPVGQRLSILPYAGHIAGRRSARCALPLVIPAQAGIHARPDSDSHPNWTPAFAGVTENGQLKDSVLPFGSSGKYHRPNAIPAATLVSASEYRAGPGWFTRSACSYHRLFRAKSVLV